ncbi:histidine kinase [Planococcus glaciei]|uniref:sensor histidine kinase n=1 Tax=Planococcus glaciei TaxID=459472 RepID=UPI00069DA451|nr:HAMP domain-containing sensor histidine kinase [Planococcus glaciei]KOF08943.1 histidine kinase [Planococcus glaciei]
MNLKNKYQMLLFTAAISVPVVLLLISVLMSIVYNSYFKADNKGIPFHESFAYPVMLIIFLLSLVCLAILFSKSINTLLNKINLLNTTIHNLASDEKIPHILDVDSKDEIGELIQSVNLLIERTTYRELELKQQSEIKKEQLNKLRHDINTPLTAVKLQLFYLEDQFKDHKPILESLYRQIEYMGQLTNEFSMESIDTVENSYIINDEVNLHRLLETMIKKWSYLYNLHGIELIYKSVHNELSWFSNELWIERLFDNIFQNTLKHSNAEKLEVTIENGIVTIRDNGIGFNANAIRTGLGLKIIKDLSGILNIDYRLQSSTQETVYYFTKNEGK